MDARLCICPHCNTVSVQETSEPPICGKCSSEDVDWTNLDAKQLRENLQDCIVVLASWEKEVKKEVKWYLSAEAHMHPLTGDDVNSECPVCKSGTLGLEEGELRCRGECGNIWKPREKP